ncbi:baseplate J/gp47 family protein [Methylosinus sp. H3A]|uniref:baseplate J/gp47 family protein n=1 Tax=Methylosinus sp. H3A TaxID=2785786 RepID=UPI0018C348BB|nr:baseplate J/gp47 family protein [Methylosinus sp. H3A]MBG0809848.1 baseplate J/gp47 family protein [Methylosinus sp. H3A]
MSARFDRVDLSAIAAPAALEAWSFDAILDARFQKFLEYWQAERVKNPSLPLYDVTALVGNPGAWHQRVDTFREGLLRQRVNEAVLATSLAFAEETDLDVVAANYGCVRASGESDTSLRLRAQLAWEALSRGGSYGGYEFDARSAAPADIADVAIYGHEVDGVARGEVRIVVLGVNSSGVTPEAVLKLVRNRVSPRNVRKVNDYVNVVAATIAPYEIDATIVVPHGADGDTVRDAQFVRAKAYAESRRKIGAPVTFGGVMAAIGHDDAGVVVDVEMRAPWAGAQNLSSVPAIGGGPLQAPVCTGVKLYWRTAA